MFCSDPCPRQRQRQEPNIVGHTHLYMKPSNWKNKIICTPELKEVGLQKKILKNKIKMYGLLLLNLQEFVCEKYGDKKWDAVKEALKLGDVS